MKFLILALIFSLALSGCINSSDIEVTISVTDTEGNSIEDARIVFAPHNDNFASNVRNTNSRGHATVLIIPTTYDITITKDGYLTSVQETEVVIGMPRIEVELEETG